MLRLPNEPTVQGSDTTKADLKTDAGKQKNTFRLLLKKEDVAC